MAAEYRLTPREAIEILVYGPEGKPEKQGFAKRIRSALGRTWNKILGKGEFTDTSPLQFKANQLNARERADLIQSNFDSYDAVLPNTGALDLELVEPVIIFREGSIGFSFSAERAGENEIQLFVADTLSADNSHSNITLYRDNYPFIQRGKSGKRGIQERYTPIYSRAVDLLAVQALRESVT